MQSRVVIDRSARGHGVDGNHHLRPALEQIEGGLHDADVRLNAGKDGGGSPGPHDLLRKLG